MAYDFQKAIEAAQQVVDKANNNGAGNENYKYPLIYPQKGASITIRPLFNPASGQIVRLVNRHEKVACYRTYGIDCPICKVQQDVKDLTGQDPFGRKSASKSRGICFAQYISSTLPVNKGGDRGNLSPGEIILFMFPWTVYQTMNEQIQAVAQQPTGMDQAFCHAQSGLYLQITVSEDFRYSTVAMPYMSYATLGANNQPMTDDEFMKFLDSMESLSEQVLPSTITEEVDKQVKEYTDAIYRQYIAPATPPQVGIPQGTAPVSAGQIPTPAAPVTPQPTTPAPQATHIVPEAVPGAPTVTNMAPPTPPVVTAGSPPMPPVPGATQVQSDPNNSMRPSCFGKYQVNAPSCIVCVEDLACKEATPAQ